ncbi:MAG: hypothetical protein HYY18_21510 [Planctomycetes bacterium]|nr:hypothetical protein [Planctomycetota bacterium]
MTRTCAALAAMLLASCASTERDPRHPEGTGPYPGLRAPGFRIAAVEHGAPDLLLPDSVRTRPLVLVFGTYS